MKDEIAKAIAASAEARSTETTTTAKQQVEEQQAAAQTTETIVPIVENQGGGYVGSTCTDRAASGVGSDFRSGDANYTSARDRDGGGVACES